jgi:hypothetical protein
MTKEEALTLALKALEHSHANEPIWKTPHREAITAIKEALAQPEQEPVAWLTDDERKAFERFNETCEDGEGYDVPKTMMKRLAEIGVIHHTSRGIYGITKFGRSLVGDTTPPQREVEHAMRLYKAVERLSLQAGEETEETIDWLCGEHGGMFKLFQAYFSPRPPQRTWVGLTEQDIDIAFDDTQEGGGFDDFARAIEAKLKEKNT